jgi:hypothetical protein
MRESGAPRAMNPQCFPPNERRPPLLAVFCTYSASSHIAYILLHNTQKLHIYTITYNYQINHMLLRNNKHKLHAIHIPDNKQL